MENIFEFPELLNLNGDPFSTIIWQTDPGGGCSDGCDNGCCSGCVGGGGTGSSKPVI